MVNSQRTKLDFLPAMATIAVRNKVVSNNHFPLTFCPQSLQINFICYIKSRLIVCIDGTEDQRKIGLS